MSDFLELESLKVGHGRLSLHSLIILDILYKTSILTSDIMVFEGKVRSEQSRVKVNGHRAKWTIYGGSI